MGERDGIGKNTAEDAPQAAPAEAESLVEMVLTEHAERAAARVEPAPRLDGVVIGVLCGVGPAGEPIVDFHPNPRGEPLPARSAVAVDDLAIGRQAALMFEGGDPARPILLGLLHRPVEASTGADGPPQGAGVEVEADGEKVVVSAQRELVLRCGEASITLTRAGKILIRGAYVLTRSTGVNRIQGGSVEIN